MLIGLLAKTAILITEFASERRRQGMGIVEAAYAAAQERPPPDFDDGIDHDIRYVAPDVRFGCRSQR